VVKELFGLLVDRNFPLEGVNKTFDSVKEASGVIGQFNFVGHVTHWGLAKACCEIGGYFSVLAGMRRSLFTAASSRKQSWS
jgi:hypothetical protein